MTSTVPTLRFSGPWVTAAVLLALLGCGDPSDDTGSNASDVPARPVEPPTAPAGSTAAGPEVELPALERPRVVFVGTSLTAGYGLADPTTEAWPAQVATLAAATDTPLEIVNAGVSGDTSAGGLRRVVPLLIPAPAVVVIELGANDGLRGLSTDDLRANLHAAVDSVRRHAPDAAVLVVRMEAPRNLGREYVEDFSDVFDDVHSRDDVVAVPFFLDGVAGVASLNQPDGIHPVAEGHRRMAEIVWPVLHGVLATQHMP